MKILSWNINGIRSILKKELFYPAFETEQPDIICLQEVRASNDQFTLSDSFKNEYPWMHFNECKSKKGYSGTAIISKIKPIKFIEGTFDLDQGRVTVAEFEKFTLVCVYVPNSGSRFDYRVGEWDALFNDFIVELQIDKPVIVCGDFNVVSNKEIDLYNSKSKGAGATKEEIANFKIVLETYVDSFRYLNPNKVKYSWWSNMHSSRDKNNGWRIDYFLVSKQLLDNITDADILCDVHGSDHCPVSLII